MSDKQQRLPKNELNRRFRLQVAANIKEWRKEHPIAIWDAANHYGCTRQYMHKVLSTGATSHQTLMKISKATGIPMEQLTKEHTDEQNV